MIARSASASGIVSKACLVSLFALAAASIVIALFIGSKEVVLCLIGALGLLVSFAVSGNQRLFCLWGVALTAPLGVQKAFFISAHMGGASSVTIDVVDIFLVPLLIFILRDYRAGRLTRLRFTPIMLWWGAMMFIGVVDFTLGPLRQLALLEVIRMAKSALLFLIIVNEIVRVRQMLHFCFAIATGIAMQSMFAIIQFSLGRNLGLSFLGEPNDEATTSATKSVYLGVGDIFRAGGLFSHPNLLAGYLALLLPICIALIFSRAAVTYKALLGATIVLGLSALVITLSRSGWMSFAAAFTVLFGFSMLHKRLRGRYVMARVIVISCIVLAAGFASGSILRRFNESDPGALKFRYEMMDTAWRMVAAHPVFGLGTNSFVNYLPEYAPRPGPDTVTQEYGSIWPVVHDSYLITWTEQGTVGFTCLCALYLTVLWMGLRTSRHMLNDYAYAINLGACCGIIAIMVDGIGSFFIDENASQRVFWMVVGLIAAVHEWTRANLPPQRRSAIVRAAVHTVSRQRAEVEA